MCGISGILNLNKPAPINPDSLRRMTYALRHRGPDECGAYLSDWINLAQSRLSIIDLQSGSQPIHNEDSTLWIAFNGEIFNYPELKEKLLKTGHRFYTNTDTEVILHLYEEKKERCLEDLNGQFAIVVWDSVNRELFLARDRVGILPLFYKIENDKLIFSSEIKAIIEAAASNTEFDPVGLEQIFTFWTNIPGNTAFKNIKELPPGHFMKVSNGYHSIHKYWDIPFNEFPFSANINTDQAVEQIKELLLDSIKIRLRADVPVGSYLSGGLDSSGITALVKGNFNNELRTFGITFQDENFDESKFQKMVVSGFDTNHSEVYATNSEIGKYFQDSIYYGERPIFRTAPVPLFLLSKKVREQDYKVVLTGEGADEVFCGYNIFRETKVRKFWSVDPDSKFRPKLLRKLYPYIFKDKRLFGTLEAFFKQGMQDTANNFYSHLVRWNNTSRLKNFFSNELKQQIGSYNVYEDLKLSLPADFEKADTISRAQYLEILTFMSGYLLSSQGDRMAMANSVEIRVPYLDHRVIEFMAAIPSRFKLRGLNEKYLLKKVFKNILPKEIVFRPKNPYRAPIRNSFINNLHFNPDEFLSEGKINDAGVFDFKKLNLLIQKSKKLVSLSELDNMGLAGIISTQILYDKFICFKKQPIPGDYQFNLLYDYRSENYKSTQEKKWHLANHQF